MNLKRLVIFLSLPVLLFACGRKEEAVHQTAVMPSITVTVERVERGHIPRFSESVGTVKAARVATVASKIMGSISRINFREGDRVKEGAVLVEMDDSEMRAQLEQAHAAVTEATAAFRNAEINLKRMKALLEEKSATQQQVDNAVMQFDTAKARIAQAEANAEVLKVVLGNARVHAPFDGVITGKEIEKGEMATPGRPLFRLTDDRRLRLEAEVRESEIKGIKAGTAIEVRVEAIDRVLEGKVSQIVPSGDPATHSFLVKIDLPETEGLLSGMFGRAYLSKGMTASILVPTSAIIEKGQHRGVFIVRNNTAGLRIIKTGIASGGMVEVLSGLTEGEEVAVSSLEKLTDGCSVEVVR